MENKIICEITKDFALKATDKCFEIEDRIVSEAGLDEGLEVFSLGARLRSLKEKLGDQAPNNEEYVRVVIKYADKLADVFSRVCVPHEVDPLVPDSAKTPEVLNEYRRRGANALADLCARSM